MSYAELHELYCALTHIAQSKGYPTLLSAVLAAPVKPSLEELLADLPPLPEIA